MMSYKQIAEQMEQTFDISEPSTRGYTNGEEVHTRGR